MFIYIYIYIYYIYIQHLVYFIYMHVVVARLFDANWFVAPRPLSIRLRVALTILCASPSHAPTSMEHAARAETAALRLSDSLAGWLMSRHSHEGSTDKNAYIQRAKLQRDPVGDEGE